MVHSTLLTFSPLIYCDYFYLIVFLFSKLIELPLKYSYSYIIFHVVFSYILNHYDFEEITCVTNIVDLVVNSRDYEIALIRDNLLG